jgi:hypothetical protein
MHCPTGPMPTGPANVVDDIDFRRQYAAMVANLAKRLTRETRGLQPQREIGPQ